MGLDSIILQPNEKDGIGFQITELSRIIEKSKQDEKNIKIDFQGIRFIQPTTLLGISSIIQTYRKKGINYNLCSVDNGVQSYLETVKFPVGLFPEQDGNWSQTLDSYKDKNYIPLINFPTSSNEGSTVIRDSVIKKVKDIIEYKLDLNGKDMKCVHYFIDEFTENIVEHSGESCGRIMIQYYPVKEYLEICIIDEGKSILGSYLENGKTEITNDKEAIRAALNGISTKSQERGFGFHTSLDIIFKAIGGNVCVVSGAGMYANQLLIKFPSYWKGTLLSIKIPKKFENPDSYYDFVK